jgi:ribosomal protein S18 acetylase RimI-like enzyme
VTELVPEMLTFRFAGPPDVPGVVALVDSAYRGESSRDGWTTEADLLDGQRTDAAAVAEILGGGPHHVVMLAESGGQLAGCCQLARRPEREAYFGMFAVRPAAQGQGWGRQILTEAERLTREDWGANRMTMTVLAQREDLIGWYRRRGYRPTGDRRPFPYGDPRAGTPRRPDLYFVVLAKDLPVRL